MVAVAVQVMMALNLDNIFIILSLLTGSSSIALFGAFQLVPCAGAGAGAGAGGGGTDHGVAVEDSSDTDSHFGGTSIELDVGEFFERKDCSSSSSSSSGNSIVIVCNTHLFSHNAGDAVRLVQVHDCAV